MRFDGPMEVSAKNPVFIAFNVVQILPRHAVEEPVAKQITGIPTIIHARLVKILTKNVNQI